MLIDNMLFCIKKYRKVIEQIDIIFAFRFKPLDIIFGCFISLYFCIYQGTLLNLLTVCFSYLTIIKIIVDMINKHRYLKESSIFIF